MTILDYYNSLSKDSPQDKFRKELMERCGVSYPVFYNWITNRSKTVPLLAKQEISKITGIAVDELFPTKK